VCIFFIFCVVQFTLAQLVMSPPYPLPGAACPPADVVTPPYRVMLPSGNALSHHLPSRAETESLNPHQLHRLPTPDRLTLNLHCYKKIILSLTTQWHLHFASSLAIAPHIRAPPTAVVPFHCCRMSIVPSHNDTHGDKLADPLLVPEQFIGL
jgi:hypothetical protein